MKSILSLLSICSFMLLLWSCSKEPLVPLATTQLTSPAADSTELVSTPFGMKPKNKVHIIKDGDELKIIDGRMKEVERATGKVVNDFGDISNVKAGARTLPSGARPSATMSYPESGGYVANAGWNSSNLIYQFKTQWTVPPVPTTNNGQQIYIFNGLQDYYSDYILQPVLQWGSSHAGGGNYWAIANWMVDINDNYYVNSLVSVSAGEVLTGTIYVTSSATGGNYNYAVFFNRNSSTTLPGTLYASNLPPTVVAFESLETYGISAVTDYPATDVVPMNSIDIRINDISTIGYPSWSVQSPINNHHAVAVNNYSFGSGEVDLFIAPGVPSHPGFGSSYPIVVSWNPSNDTGLGGVSSYDISYTIYPPAGSPITESGTSTTTSYTISDIAYHQYSGGELIAKVRAHYSNGAVSDWSSDYNMTLN